MKPIFSSLFLIAYSFCIGQNKKFEGAILMDPDFKGKIGLYNKPGGTCIKLLQHNFKGEDFICMEIRGQNDSMFYVSVDLPQAGHIVNGWVKMSRHIGVYNRNDPQGLALYTSPSMKSSIRTRLKKSTFDFLKVIGCDGKWLKIEKKVNGIIQTGWIPLEKQCANPYTTCC
ncbi:MAG: hypothetical protein V4722_17960 [Bacteroidota bacterium]